jgi:transcriptional regulator of arginine metabolism
MKEKRHAKILEIIREHDVETQEELCDYLNQEGYRVTQATVSRDIRELQLTKVSMPGGHQKYTLFTKNELHLKDKYGRVFREGAVSIETAQNILVIHTVTGMAMAVAVALDSMDCEEIVGTIAGDDTIMCAVKTCEEAETLKERLRGIMLE